MLLEGCIQGPFLLVFKFHLICFHTQNCHCTPSKWLLRLMSVQSNEMLYSSSDVRMREWEIFFTRDWKSVYGDDAVTHYLVKVGMPKYGILLEPADRTLHKHLPVCSVLTIRFWRADVCLWKRCQSNGELGKRSGWKKLAQACWQISTKKPPKNTVCSELLA
jgi:hypothetical protein